jgi:hypothetical protein
MFDLRVSPYSHMTNPVVHNEITVLHVWVKMFSYLCIKYLSN